MTVCHVDNLYKKDYDCIDIIINLYKKLKVMRYIFVMMFMVLLSCGKDNVKDLPVISCGNLYNVGGNGCSVYLIDIRVDGRLITFTIDNDVIKLFGVNNDKIRRMCKIGIKSCYKMSSTFRFDEVQTLAYDNGDEVIMLLMSGVYNDSLGNEVSGGMNILFDGGGRVINK